MLPVGCRPFACDARIGHRGGRPAHQRRPGRRLCRACLSRAFPWAASRALLLVCLALAIALCWSALPAAAAVIVVANRAASAVSFRMAGEKISPDTPQFTLD